MGKTERYADYETDRKINAAVAVFMNWKWLQVNHDSPSGLIGTDEPHSGNVEYQGRSYPSKQFLPMYGKRTPDYVNDLNAMREVEKRLTPSQMREYYNSLVHFAWLAGNTEGSTIHDTYTVHLPARAKAEVALRVIGKWEEWREYEPEFV